MNFPLWDFSTPSNMFSSAQKGPFSSNVSSYFRRPSKIVKQPSRNNSPRTSSRRRMTNPGQMPVRTRSVVDHQRASMPHLSDSRAITTRPISWHPNMLDDITQFQMANMDMTGSVINTPFTTAEINGLVTPISFPMMDEPQIQELITPLEGLSANEADLEYGYGQDFDMTQYWLSEQAKDSTIDFNPSLYPMLNSQPQWFPANQYIMPNVPTAPTSPSFLPMSEYGMFDSSLPQPKEEPEELVAMGLYDSPAEVQSSSLLFGGSNGFTGRKTLKLEDSFEPSSTNEEEEEDDAEAEEDDDDQPGISPTTIDAQQPSMADMSVAPEFVPMMDNSYVMNQWQMPVHNGYGWI